MADLSTPRASLGAEPCDKHFGTGGTLPAPNEKLAASLEQLALMLGDRHVFHSAELSRTHRERLERNGFVQRAAKGWFFVAEPGVRPGESTMWYSCFWEFCARYCEERFGESWHLSAEGSLLHHAGANGIPRQAIVHSPLATHHCVNLPFDTSLFHLAQKNEPDRSDVMVDDDGLRLLTPDAALVRMSESFFRTQAVEATTVLTQMADHRRLLRRLLDGAHTTIAGRLAGAFRTVGRTDVADELVAAMTSAGHAVRETRPFASAAPVRLSRPAEQPAATRIRVMWEDLRGAAAAAMPQAPRPLSDIDAYLATVDDSYRYDAYHSLSIEGYRVTPELIERVRSGTWTPDTDPNDASSRDALAARGYWQTFQQVRDAVAEVVNGANAAALARDRHRDWYRSLFAPSVESGLFGAGDLGGYRQHAVYLSGSRHVPTRWEAVPEAMAVLFELLDEEEEPSVRAVLGHFFFVYIHPYTDGNGRLARFLMNTMLASGGYPWTVFGVGDRNEYMNALESASVGQTIEPFAKFVAARIGVLPAAWGADRL